MTDWGRARCVGVDPELFAPFDFEGDFRGKAAQEDRRAKHSAAAAVCRGCPLLDACRDRGLRDSEWGVWGGLLLNQGVPYLMDGGELDLAPCGTNAAYVRHRRAKEKPCKRCVDGHAERRRVERLEVQRRQYPCGTVAAVKRHGRAGEPLCEACQVASSTRNRGRKKVAA